MGKRDIQLAEEVRLSVKRIKSFKDKFGRPIQISKQLIARDIDKRTVLSKRYLAKLPLTVKALDEVVETRIKFACHRILWAVSCFTQEGVVPSFSRLAERAGVTNSVSLSEVNSALESAILSLRGGNTCAVKVP